MTISLSDVGLAVGGVGLGSRSLFRGLGLGGGSPDRGVGRAARGRGAWALGAIADRARDSRASGLRSLSPETGERSRSRSHSESELGLAVGVTRVWCEL